IASASVVFMRRKPASLGTPVMRALVRWPSYESQCRFSPDGAWVSFISDRTRQRSIWLRRTSGGEPAMLATHPEGIDSQVWSPAGDEIAYLSYGSNDRVLHFVPVFGGGARDGIPLDDRFVDARLVRWIGGSLYIESQSGLWRLNRVTHNAVKIADRQSP